MNKKHLAPYVPSHFSLVDTMLDLAEIIPGERVYDLGCGDGRIIARAALPPYYAKAVGIEKNEKLVLEAKRIIKSFNLQKRVEIVPGNIFDYDYRDADVIFVYLTRKQNKYLKPKLENELKERARVVSHDFKMWGWEPSKVLSIFVPYGDTPFLKDTEIFLYKMNEAFK